MAQIRGYSFTTAPDEDVAQISQRLVQYTARLVQEGRRILSIQAHNGVVDGVPCTVGYVILTIEADLSSAPPQDDVQLVVAL